MKIKTSLWMLAIAVVVSVSALLIMREKQTVSCDADFHDWLWRGPGGTYGIETFRGRYSIEVYEKGKALTFPETGPLASETCIHLGPCGTYLFNLSIYGFLLLAGLPILATVNVGFSLYRRVLGSAAKPSKHDALH